MKPCHPITLEKQGGFTLIELSIVLVIIGLIVGGVLVGQDLIKAAEIRATVGQVEKYNSAVNTFRTKYNAIPGDITSANAISFGLFADTTGGQGHGDGNGLIEGGNTAPYTAGIGETLAFWRHLTDANLVDGSFGSTGNSLIVATSGAVTGTVNTISQSLPPGKVGRANSFVTYSSGGLNFYQILPVASIPTSGAYTFNSAGSTPMEAYNMDVKLDDGAPNTGIVVARGITDVNIAPTSNPVATGNTCTVGSGIASDTYNRNAGTGGTDPSCSLRFRFN